MANNRRSCFIFRARNAALALGSQTALMGIVNITPDSFSGDGCLAGKDFHTKAYKHALKHIRDGASILDIGGESTRPGSIRIPASEEMARILPTIKQLTRKTDAIVSVDTNKTTVAKAALNNGAHMINTIKGTHAKPHFLKTIARYNAGIVIMHMGGGTPRTMQKGVSYETDIIDEIVKKIRISIEKCLEYGIKSDRIMIDPGIGFGKTVEHNLRIINTLQKFRAIKKPVLIGPSRKSFIGITLNKDARHRAWGTAATVAASIMNGAHILRVHDVKQMIDVVRMTDAIINESRTENT